MNTPLIRIILLIIFSASVYFTFEFGAGNTYSNYTGGAIGFGLIGAASVIGFVYLEVNHNRKKN